MQISLDTNTSTYQIRSYAPGKITINDKTYTHSVILTVNELIEDWPPQSVAELKPEYFEIVINKKPEVLIVGTGQKQAFPDPALFATIYELNIGVEIMTTNAACRTYNVLSAEGRNVLAALLIT